jgi:hypothetical protein
MYKLKYYFYKQKYLGLKNSICVNCLKGGSTGHIKCVNCDKKIDDSKTDPLCTDCYNSYYNSSEKLLNRSSVEYKICPYCGGTGRNLDALPIINKKDEMHHKHEDNDDDKDEIQENTDSFFMKSDFSNDPNDLPKGLIDILTMTQNTQLMPDYKMEQPTMPKQKLDIIKSILQPGMPKQEITEPSQSIVKQKLDIVKSILQPNNLANKTTENVNGDTKRTTYELENPVDKKDLSNVFQTILKDLDITESDTELKVIFKK